MGKVRVALGVLLAVGVADYLLASVSTADSTVRRLGLHQDKQQAYWLYFFIAHLYDNLLNPWHWTEIMRDQALAHADLCSSCVAIDVGAGTGFTSIGVLKAGVKNLTMVDQSHAQLSKAAAKPELAGVTKLVGDAERLDLGTDYADGRTVPIMPGSFDRYTSAGSIEYWPNPEVGISEAFRVLKPGGRATIIGPVHPEYWVSKLFADLWYLFPTRTEYIRWFADAGFKEVEVFQITPEWYTEDDRDHGLIMGFVVTGIRPLGSTVLADLDTTTTTEPLPTALVHPRAFPTRAVLFLPRFVLGNIGGAYYAVLPVFVYLKNVYCFGSAAVAFLVVLLVLLPALWLAVLPLHWAPLGNEKKLYDGIATFYDRSSGIWERVWGEHMHSGFYGVAGTEVDKDPQQAQHDMMEHLLNFSGVQRTGVRSAIDIGCGIGGSSRFLARECRNAKVVGVTLSSVQQARATELTAQAGLQKAVRFEVANALSLPFPDDSFDLAWSLESGEHMPDKATWLQEVRRILKPGGTFVCATWCHRETKGARPLDSAEIRHLGRICKNYALPAWVPLSTYTKVCSDTGLRVEATADWTASILPFWPAVIRSALRPAVLLQLLFFTSWATIKGAITAVLMMQGFEMDLLVFGAFCATKQAESASCSAASGLPTSGSTPLFKPSNSHGNEAMDSAAIYLYGHTPTTSFLSALYRFSYPHTWVGTILSVSVVSYIGFREASLGITDEMSSNALQAYAVALGSALCVNLYIVGINQIFDVEIDKVNKPYLPIASGEWSVEFAAQLSVGLLGVGIGIGFMYGTPALQYTLVASAALGTAYSTDLPLLRWKKYPLLASGCILSVRAVIVQVGFFSHMQQALPEPVRVEWGDCDAMTFSIVFILTFSIVIAFFKDLPDVPGDVAGGVNTLAVRLGAPLIFTGCVTALCLDYAGAVLFSAFHGSWAGAAAHLLAVAILASKAPEVDLDSEASIKRFYMLIWKLFYAEYLIMLLL